MPPLFTPEAPWRAQAQASSLGLTVARTSRGLQLLSAVRSHGVKYEFIVRFNEELIVTNL